MSTPLSEPHQGRAFHAKFWKYSLRRVLFPLCVFTSFAYFFHKLTLFYAICGAYDVSRNTGLNLSTLRRYFISNGVLVWVLSPINILLDLLSLPYVNKGVYCLEDLPPGHQAEITRVIQLANGANLVGQLEEQLRKNNRSMIFWRWYGVKLDAPVAVDGFDEPWKYIRTIGLSVFNKKITTSLHFGQMRASLRVLYNINDIKDKSAYIIVGNTTSYWCDNKLFIFDDTLLHRSANDTDQLRYCLYVDILRPSSFPRIMGAVVAIEGYLNRKFKFVQLSRWTLITGRRRQ